MCFLAIRLGFTLLAVGCATGSGGGICAGSSVAVFSKELRHPQDRIGLLATEISWKVQHPLTVCDGANLNSVSASVWTMPGVGGLAAGVEDTSAAVFARRVWAWAAGTFADGKQLVRFAINLDACAHN